MKIKVRIAVAVDPCGDWSSCGWGSMKKRIPDDELMGNAIDSIASGEARYFLEAELELPKGQTIQVEPSPA